MDDKAIWGIVIMGAIAVAGGALLLRLSDKADRGITFFDVLWCVAFGALLVLYGFDLPPVASAITVGGVSVGAWGVREAIRQRRLV